MRESYFVLALKKLGQIIIMQVGFSISGYEVVVVPNREILLILEQHERHFTWFAARFYLCAQTGHTSIICCAIFSCSNAVYLWWIV